MRVDVRRVERHEVDHVDEAHREVGEVLRRSHAAASASIVGMSPGAGDHDVGLASSRRCSAHSQTDAPAAQCAGRRLEVEVLQLGLLVDDDQVHVVAAAEAVVGHREEAVGVRRQVDPRTVPFMGRTCRSGPGPGG